MDEVEVESLDAVELTDPVLVEGLPGVGHVGKLAAEHIVEEYDGTLVERIYSEHLPPQVAVDDDGRSTLAHLALHAVETDGRDLLVLTGDHQSQDVAGHYRLVEAVLDLADSYGTTELFALGGVPTGELVEEYTVLGAGTEDDLIEDLEAEDVEFGGEEPAGGIVGTSGLLLGLGERRDIAAACLMGETSGYLVDPKSSQALLEVLCSTLDFDVDFDALEERADEMEDVASKLQEMDDGMSMPSEEDLRYIG